MRYMQTLTKKIEDKESSESEKRDAAIDGYERHIARLEATLTHASFPTIDYKSIVVLVGDIVPVYGDGKVFWRHELQRTPEYRKVTAKIKKCALQGIEIIDKAHRPCILPGDFYTRDSKGSYEAMRDALFDEEAALQYSRTQGDLLFEPVMPIAATTLKIYRDSTSREYKVFDGYARVASLIASTESLEEGIIDGYHLAIPRQITPPLIEQLKATVLQAFEYPLREEETSFDAWVTYGSSILDAGISQGKVRDLGLLFKIGDTSKTKDERMTAFIELRDKYCGISGA